MEIQIFHSDDYDYISQSIVPLSNLASIVDIYGHLHNIDAELFEKMQNDINFHYGVLLPWLLMVRKELEEDTTMPINTKADYQKSVENWIRRIWSLKKPTWVHSMMSTLSGYANELPYLTNFHLKTPPASAPEDTEVVLEAYGSVNQGNDPIDYNSHVYSYDIKRNNDDSMRYIAHFFNRWSQNQGNDIDPFKIETTFKESHASQYVDPNMQTAQQFQAYIEKLIEKLKQNLIQYLHEVDRNLHKFSLFDEYLFLYRLNTIRFLNYQNSSPMRSEIKNMLTTFDAELNNLSTHTDEVNTITLKKISMKLQNVIFRYRIRHDFLSRYFQSINEKDRRIFRNTDDNEQIKKIEKIVYILERAHNQMTFFCYGSYTENNKNCKILSQLDNKWEHLMAELFEFMQASEENNIDANLLKKILTKLEEMIDLIPDEIMNSLRKSDATSSFNEEGMFKCMNTNLYTLLTDTDLGKICKISIASEPSFLKPWQLILEDIDRRVTHNDKLFSYNCSYHTYLVGLWQKIKPAATSDPTILRIVKLLVIILLLDIQTKVYIKHNFSTIVRRDKEEYRKRRGTFLQKLYKLISFSKRITYDNKAFNKSAFYPLFCCILFILQRMVLDSDGSIRRKKLGLQTINAFIDLTFLPTEAVVPLNITVENLFDFLITIIKEMVKLGTHMIYKDSTNMSTLIVSNNADEIIVTGVAKNIAIQSGTISIHYDPTEKKFFSYTAVSNALNNTNVAMNDNNFEGLLATVLAGKCFVVF